MGLVMVRGSDALDFFAMDIHSIDIGLTVIVINHHAIVFTGNMLTPVRDKDNLGSRWIPRWIGICKNIICDLAGSTLVNIVNKNIAGNANMSHKGDLIPFGAPGCRKNTIHLQFNFLAFSCFYINDMQHISLPCFGSYHDLFTIR